MFFGALALHTGASGPSRQALSTAEVPSEGAGWHPGCEHNISIYIYIYIYVYIYKHEYHRYIEIGVNMNMNISVST